MTDEKTILKDLVNPKKDIIEIWRKPLFCTVQLKVQKSGQNPAKQCVLDLSQPLGTMIPILQKVFSKDIKLEEFSLFLLEKGRIERLNTNKSLLDCRFKGQEQLLMVPLSLQFRRKYADTTSHCQKEGVLEKMSVHGGSLTGKKTRHFVLTEGYLFYYKKKGDTAPAGAVALEYHSMRKMVIKAEQSDSLLLKRTFYGFKTKAAEMFVLRGSEPDLVTWRDALKSHVMNMARRTFGEALTDSESLPPVVSVCLDYLRTRLECEGLFRISGSAALIEYYKDKFDQGMDVDLSACEDPHVVASLLKMWFRELPEPVIPFSLYDLLTRRNLAGEAWAAFLLEQVKALPRLNFLILRSLLLFLAEVASHEAQNKMSAANLATCFGPNLMWPAEDDQTNMVADTPLVMATTVAPPPRPANKKPKIMEIQQSRPPSAVRPAAETTSEPVRPETKPEAKPETKPEAKPEAKEAAMPKAEDAVPPPPPDEVKPPVEASTPSPEPTPELSPKPVALQASAETEVSDYQGKVARTLYDFSDAADARKLPFHEGELILILEKGPPGWWAAEKNGERGFVAEGYFELLGEEQTEAEEEGADVELQVGDLRRELKDQRRKTEALQHLVSQLVSRLESLEAQVAAQQSSSPSESPDKLAIGTRVVVRGKEAELGPGTLRYLGPLHSREGRWAGIELEKALGRNDGSVDDKRYFTCKPQWGVFVPASGVDVAK